MWTIPRITVAAAAATLLLSGCAPTARIAGPAPQPTSTPMFANEAEALAAATKAYAAYVKVSDEILADGGANPGRIKMVATGRQLEADMSGFGSAEAQKLHGVGSTIFESLTLQQYDEQISDSTGEVIVYLCEDISNVDVRDDTGRSVVSSNRPNRVKYQVTFAESPSAPAHLLVSDKAPWEGGTC